MEGNVGEIPENNTKRGVSSTTAHTCGPVDAFRLLPGPEFFGVWFSSIMKTKDWMDSESEHYAMRPEQVKCFNK